MKHNKLNSRLTIFSLLIAFSTGFSQTKEQTEIYTKNYDKEKLTQLETKFENDFLSEKTEATKLAKINNWPIRYSDSKGTLYELKKVSDSGMPMYYRTFNDDAAISTRASFLHTGSFFGFNLDGDNMTAHIWDGGLARSNHSEYDGPGGNNRFSVGDGTSTLNFHAAHVTGTVIAYGANASAKGMAPNGNAVGYDWNNDTSEATNAAANGMLISNHSYGYQAASIADQIFGAYIQDSRNWDNLMYNTPYYLMVVAAGNDGTDDSSNGLPLSGNSAYDKLSGHATSKNNLVVANGTDATVDFVGNLTSVSRNSGSSEGPTDDLRIKPDIMGNGSGLTSTLDSNDFAYGTLTGTSMASPNVSGSLLLLQEHYNNVNSVFMKAATLKGLALHTADDVSPLGPDSETGWGLLNSLKAAQTISNNGAQSYIAEESLLNEESFSITVVSDGTNPLLASISWTDLPGNVSSGVANDPTAVLVNDLDIKVTQDAFTGEAWKLTGVNSNSTGDNTVDPFERVDVTGASGSYTITVTHKGTLINGFQNFSLVVTGISSVLNTSDFDLGQLKIWPNPVKSNLFIEMNNTSSAPVNVSIYDLQGRLVYINEYNNHNSLFNQMIDLSNIANGSYIIKIEHDNKRATKQLIINN